MIRLLVCTLVLGAGILTILVLSSEIDAATTVLPEEDSTDSPKMLMMDEESKNSTISSSIKLADRFMSKQEKNKRVVINLLQALFIDKNLDDVDKYIDDGPENYIQHSPFLPDGRQYLKASAQKWYDAGQLDFELLRVAAEGDLVFAHFKLVSKYFMTFFGGKAVAVVDILRLENGKVREHWDILQSLPDKAVSKHPLF